MHDKNYWLSLLIRNCNTKTVLHNNLTGQLGCYGNDNGGGDDESNDERQSVLMLMGTNVSEEYTTSILKNKWRWKHFVHPKQGSPRWRQSAPLNCWKLITNQPGVISQKTLIFSIFSFKMAYLPMYNKSKRAEVKLITEIILKFYFFYLFFLDTVNPSNYSDLILNNRTKILCYWRKK